MLYFLKVKGDGDGDGMAKKKKATRNLSKLTIPLGDFGGKDRTKAFRCSNKVANRLEREDNQSDTINKALLEYFARGMMECPTCKGKGVIRAIKKVK